MREQLGILGCGTIGSEIATAIADGYVSADLDILYDRNPRRANSIADEFDPDNRPLVADSLDELGQEADLVVEAVGQRAVDEAAVRLMEAGCDIILLSVEALAADDPRAAVLETAERTNSTVHVPSGAVAGLDAIKAAALGGELESVSLTTRKNPTNLADVPYFAESDVDIGDISEPQVVFAGSAREAARAFPSNINVAIALSIAGLGPEETSITIIVDPREENNVHRIEAVGEMGQIETTVRNVPFQTSTQTSYLAALSALEKLRSIDATMSVGT